MTMGPFTKDVLSEEGGEGVWKKGRMRTEGGGRRGEGVFRQKDRPFFSKPQSLIILKNSKLFPFLLMFKISIIIIYTSRE